MAKHLSDREIRLLEEALNRWNGPVTWNDVQAECERLIGRRPARQTLARVLSSAYEQAKRRPSSDLSIASTDVSMMAAIAALERERAGRIAAEGKVNLLLEQFVRWQYNCFKHGISRSQLDEPLPQIDIAGAKP